MWYKRRSRHSPGAPFDPDLDNDKELGDGECICWAAG